MMYYDYADIKKGLLNLRGGINMTTERLPLFIGVDTVVYDLGVSKAKAYNVIRELNKELKAQNPRAIVVAGKVNRVWYEEACLKTGER